MRLIFPRIIGLLSSYVPQILLQIHANLFCPQPVRIIARKYANRLVPHTTVRLNKFLLWNISRSIQELCPTICSSNCLPSCPFFCCKVSPSMPSSCPSSCSVSCISPCQQHCCQERYPPNFSTQSPAICPLQCAIHCDDMCPAHCCPASSEQSSFLTKSIPIGNVQPNVLLPQSYATLTPYAPVFPRGTVHTIGPSIVARVDKSPYLFKNLEQRSPVSWKVSCGSRSRL